ncbi:3-deoxy-manno-octulosonate cytidylyltransferase [Hymenobacter sp. UV11]|uniref:3-deoxy-manno-octulosonate cytidylyltransferase n=1 Tax=Hymenobacter sp. UV11 TaxID=1849735 RepID=UPI00105E9891|nr:3-deoxy-manno-octulosonate cytidylyltransferase [Hymenobacter sp. UV11]TDN37097.1 3-deoxy-manno-octulosonate cytidylyltransferase [Hymenobacter sp. UV11]TFZ67784.1 3-deoxy-manno-octulosonate cytidylyltransferase [Hymenobacter sp. UV11]
MSALGIIPARYASTRLPGKPLVDLGGQTMIQRVVAQARLAGLARVVVATDDARILDHVRGFGGEAVLTRPDHPSGTDRAWEAFELLGSPAEVSCIVNIQGDEPFIQPAQIDALVGLFAQAQPPAIATLIKPVLTEEELFSPHLPKVVTDYHGHALYFSRHPLPYQRQYAPAEWLQHHRYYRHLGLYAYQPGVLRQLTRLPPSPLELAESLEQLRWLEAGFTIQTAITELDAFGIDTPEDVARARARLGVGK